MLGQDTSKNFKKNQTKTKPKQKPQTNKQKPLQNQTIKRKPKELQILNWLQFVVELSISPLTTQTPIYMNAP